MAIKTFASSFLLLVLLFASPKVSAQWSYIKAIDESLDKNKSLYETWLGNNGYESSTSADQAAVMKAQTLSDIYGIKLTPYSFQAKRQPIKIRTYVDAKKNLRAIDIYLIRPQAGEFENVQLVLLKSGYKLQRESNNKFEKVTMTGFVKKDHRINLSYADDKSYLIISATSLGSHE